MRQKTIVITGCSTGFGRHTALTLAQHNWHVFATVRKEADREKLLQDATQRHCEQHLTILLCDITDTEQVAALAHDVEEHLRSMMQVNNDHVSVVPPLDALLNNAGTAYGGPIEMLPLADLRAQFEINVIAHVSVTQTFLPMLKAAHGTIINVSSISGRFATPITGLYAASKHALEAVSDALRLELAPFGVKVVLIEPASSPTAIWKTGLQRALEQFGDIQKSEYEPLINRAIQVAEESSKSGFPIQRFTDVVERALSTPRPRARYGVPLQATIMILMRRFLPDALWDRLIRSLFRW